MKIKPCPKCGRKPKIRECVSVNQKRKRLVGCPNYCSVITSDDPYRRVKDSWFVHIGNEDDNFIYKLWNDRIT